MIPLEANRKDKPLSSTPAGVYRRMPVFNSVTLALLILFLVIFAVSNRRRQLVNREMLLLMRDQLEQLKAAAPGDDTAELTGAGIREQTALEACLLAPVVQRRF